MSKQREKILLILNNFYSEKTNPEVLISKYTEGFDNTKRGFINTVVRSTIRYSIKTDYYIRQLSNRRFSRINPTTVNILRMSLCQIIYMEHIPTYAIIDEAVNLGKNISKRESRFINGLLRNFLRNQKKIMDTSKIHYYDRLKIEYAFPVWLIKILEDSYPNLKIDDVLKELNKDPKFEIRNNSLMQNRDELIAYLNKNGFKSKKINYLNNGIIIENPNGIFSDKSFEEGRFYVQSGASQLVTEIAEPRQNDKILDMAAAPGGKLTHMYQLIKGKGEIVGIDVSQDKLDLILDNMSRLNMENINLLIEDSTVYNKSHKNKYDLVMLDSPCSAMGLIRRYPEMKHTKTPEDIKQLSLIQNKMIENAANYVKPGKRIIYSTCSFSKEENELVIEEFLKQNKDFVLEKFIRTNIIESDGFGIGVIRREDIK